MILFLRLLFSFCFAWEDISNTRERVSSDFQTPQISSKILRYALYFQLSSRCLEIGWNTVSPVWYSTTIKAYVGDILKTNSFQLQYIEKTPVVASTPVQSREYDILWKFRLWHDILESAVSHTGSPSSVFCFLGGFPLLRELRFSYQWKPKNRYLAEIASNRPEKRANDKEYNTATG